MDPREQGDRALQELLGANTVLPEQFWGSAQQGSIARSGERALMWAVLANGIDCYWRHARSAAAAQQVEFIEAERWVSSTDWDWPFSFVNLCEAFGLDPDGVRRALARWKNRRARPLRRQRFRPVTQHAA